MKQIFLIVMSNFILSQIFTIFATKTSNFIYAKY